MRKILIIFISLTIIFSIFLLNSCSKNVNDSPEPSPKDQPIKVSLDFLPCGIYALDSAKGSIIKNGISLRDGNIRDYDFITGYAWRRKWSDFESKKGEYDFSMINDIIQKLDEINKSLSLLILPGTPEYVINNSEIWEYIDKNPRHPTYMQTTKKLVPWDPYVLERHKLFIDALSDHKVFSKSLNKEVALKNHPTFKILIPEIPGIGQLRELNFELTEIPGYSREKFSNSILTILKTYNEAFPNTYIFMGFWKIDDNNNKSLTEEIRLLILNEFDRVGFYQENLAANKNGGSPNTDFAQALFLSKESTSIGFQALQPWNKPFANPEKTKGARPADGIEYAYKTFNARYFELYVQDLDEQTNWESLRSWNDILCVKN